MNISGILEAISKLLWPILAGFLFWRLYPSIRKIIESRGFAIKVGEMEITVQEASDQLRAQVEDLQKKVSDLRAQVQQQAQPISTDLPEKAPEKHPIKSILWVDDKPANNAYEIANLRNEGFQIVQATSTDEALGKMLSRKLSVDAVISDMGRYEENQFRPRAGIDLIKAMRDAGIGAPIFIYSSFETASSSRDEVLMSDGNGITASPVELFEMIHRWGN
jgi:CheY-like chemotaxis protein